MRAYLSAFLMVASAVLLGWTPASAKRLPPEPVPPVIWRGVEYRAPLDVDHMGCVQAFDVASGRKLWETKVYTVRITEKLEEDVQWRFITGLWIQDGKLWATEEWSTWFRLDPTTGRVEATNMEAKKMDMTGWYVWGAALLVLTVYLWLRVPGIRATSPPSINQASEGLVVKCTGK